ncbi:MAG: hypothetical protein ACD_8C00134G0002 [uncultured bacterium]|nr:MAG: hypothetical protein ACD_8C00134G0002 [uncultured bacterium]
MHQDKKREELEEIKEFERMQQEELLGQEAEIEDVEETENFEKEKSEEVPIENEIERSKRKRKEMIFEFALFCILGILLGITIKTEAIKRITIGFNDYQIKTETKRYDIASMKKNLEQKALEAEQATQQMSE